MKAISREAFDLSHFSVHIITLPEQKKPSDLQFDRVTGKPPCKPLVALFFSV